MERKEKSCELSGRKIKKREGEEDKEVGLQVEEICNILEFSGLFCRLSPVNFSENKFNSGFLGEERRKRKGKGRQNKGSHKHKYRRLIHTKLSSSLENSRIQLGNLLPTLTHSWYKQIVEEELECMQLWWQQRIINQRGVYLTRVNRKWKEKERKGSNLMLLLLLFTHISFPFSILQSSQLGTCLW